MSEATLSQAARTGLGAEAVQRTIDDYEALYDRSKGADASQRRADYAALVNRYYDLVTDFYEYGWGHSFHFATRRRGEPFDASIVRHEHYLALQMGLKAGMRALDVGCGVGGPARNLAAFTGASIVGINNNDYQLGRAAKHTEAAKLEHLCSFVKGDFMKIPFEDESFDAAYAFEATCHAPDRVPVFSGVARVLKPGGLFAGYEWCVTDRYDPQNAEHREIIHIIEEGDALPELKPTSVIDEALRTSGLELLHARDLAGEGDKETPWYLPLTGQERTIRGIPRTRPGRMLTHNAVRVMETLRVAPKGATQVSALLNRAADALVRGGELGIFTPMYLFVARKPHVRRAPRPL